MTPYFTVLIDNYNRERLVREAIDSVLNQDFPAAEIEILVVDDGSTDKSWEAITSYKDKVRALRLNDVGQTRTLNYGMAQARGQVVCLLDADDFCHPERLKVMADCFKDPGIASAQTFMGAVNAKGKDILPHNPPYPAWPEIYTLEQFLDHQFHWSATSSLAFRKSVLDKILPAPAPEFQFYVEHFFLVNSLLYGSMRCVPRILSYWRDYGHHASIDYMSDPVKQEKDLRMRRFFFDQIGLRLAEKGLLYSPKFLAEEENEMLRRELLFAGYQGRHRDAFRIWRRAARAAGASGFGLFRSATLAIALVSPRLYGALYHRYYRHPDWGRWRQTLLP